jgi:hypothetical protein
LLAKRRDIGSVRAAHELLAGVFTNSKCPPPLRAAVARAYYALMSTLALSVTEAELVTYSSHILTLGVTTPVGSGAGGAGSRGRWQGAVMEDGRQVCACLATAMAGLTLRLSEDGKTLLVQVLLGELTKRSALLVPRSQVSGRAAPGAEAGGAPPDLRQAVPVTCALHALTALYNDIGGCQLAQETWELVIRLVRAPWTATRVAAAQCLRAMGSKAPQLLLPALRSNLEVLLQEVSLMHGMRAAASVQGLCMALVSTAMAARVHSHGLPCSLLDSFMSVAKMLLKERWVTASPKP